MKIIEQDLEYIYEKLLPEEKNRLKGTVLITGCAGFLGYYFMHFFNEYGKVLGVDRVIALDNFMLGKPKWIDKLSENILFDIREFNITTDKLADVNCSADADYVIHMASIASPVFYRRYPIETLDANIWGLRALLDLYADKPLKGLLFFSSSELYGDPDPANIPTGEEYRGFVSVTGPRACYDEAKRFGETMCMLYAQKYNMPIGVARPFNNYGPGMKITDERVPADFAKAVYKNEDITILSSGAPTRTFCYIADAITGYLKILLHGKYDYFNIGMESPEITITELAEIYADAGKDVFGYRGKVIYKTSDDADYLTHNPERRCPNIDKAKELLGYNPEIYVKDGVRRFLQFISESSEDEYLW
jgi:UDP-glucuronate decarboxylase